MEKFNKERDTRISIILCDLDELKAVNDQYGHKTGDLLIIEAATSLDAFSDEHTVVSRIGGDEFALLVIDKPATYVEDLVQIISQHIDSFNKTAAQIPIKVSIGFAHNETSLGKMSKLFVRADANMYEDKRRKKVLV